MSNIGLTISLRVKSSNKKEQIKVNADIAQQKDCLIVIRYVKNTGSNMQLNII